MSDAKTQMQNKDCIDLDDHVMLCSGKPLDNGRTLSECNVRPQSSLELLPRLRGGMRLEFTNQYGIKKFRDFDASDTKLDLSGKFLGQNWKPPAQACNSR